MAKNYAIILASGSGERMNLSLPKQFMELEGKTIMDYAIEAFEENNNIHEIILVTNPRYIDLTKEILSKKIYKKISKILKGGKIRRESSFIGTASIEEDDATVLIHDGARPFVSQRIINDCLEALKKHSAVTVALPCVDTIIKIDNRNFIESTLDRNYIMRVQTPQGFRSGLIKKAHAMALKEENLEVTDDCSLIEKYNLSEIYTVPGEERNIKITRPEDILWAKKILEMENL